MNRVFIQSTTIDDCDNNIDDDETTTNRESICFKYIEDVDHVDHRNKAIESMFRLLRNEEQSLDHIKYMKFSNILNDNSTTTLHDFFLKRHRTALRLHILKIVQHSTMTIQSASSIASIVTYQLSSLIDLDLSKNPCIFCKNGLELLITALFDPNQHATQSICRIQRLNLSHNMIGSNGKSVENITRLLVSNDSIQHLILSDNRLGPRHMSTNGGLFNNATLRNLDLSNNLLRDAGVKIVMDAIDPNRNSKSKLEELDLSNNKIGPIGAKSMMNVLQRNNKSLKKLNLSHNLIKGGGCGHLEQVLYFNYTLTDVNLSGNQLRGPWNTVDGIPSIAAGLSSSDYSNLLRLNLAKNMIQDSGAIVLADMIRNNRKLETLNLSNNAIQNDGMKAIIKALPHHIALKELLLHGNQINEEDALVTYICDTDLCTLHLFTFAYNHFKPLQIENIDSAFQFHNNKKTWLGTLLHKIEAMEVRSIRLLSSDVIYGDKELSSIANQFDTYPVEIRSVYFDSEKITDLGMSDFVNNVLCSTREKLRVIRFICYNLTKLQTAGITSIARCLARSPCALLSITLLNCNIGPEGARAIAHYLESNQSLTLLSLRSNHILDIGARSIFEAVLDPPHATLKILNLSQNRLTDAAVKGVGRFVQLVDVLLNENDISDRGVLDICKAVMDTTSIQYLNLSHNPQVTPKGIQALQLFLPNQFVLESELLDC